MEQSKKLSLAEYREIGTWLHRLRVSLIAALIADVVCVLFLNLLVTLGVNMEMEFCINVANWLDEDSTVYGLIVFIPNAIVLIYYTSILMLHTYEKGLLAAGVFGIAGFLYRAAGSNVNSESVSKVESSLSTMLSTSLLLLLLGVIFRKIYCDSMKKAAGETFDDTRKKWDGLWKLTLVVAAVSAVLLVVFQIVLRTEMEDFKRYSDSFDSFDLDSYYDLVTRIVNIVTIMANIVTITEVILFLFELKCVKSTQEDVDVLIRAEEDSMRPDNSGLI
ncbi:MAG: hypothetical protein IK055_07060 [Lachnospiraceae bacterium]|nr:hypothetical protein [Lachnospiraceae bacterium]